MIDVDVLIKNLQRFKKNTLHIFSKNKKTVQKCAILAPKNEKRVLQPVYRQIFDLYL